MNPNGKVPAIIDGNVRMFDSNAIPLFLAEREKRSVPVDIGTADREKLRRVFDELLVRTLVP